MVWDLARLAESIPGQAHCLNDTFPAEPRWCTPSAPMIKDPWTFSPFCGNNINSAIDKLDLCDSMLTTAPSILVLQAVVESFEKPLAVEKQERVPMSTTLHSARRI